jgi:membrane-associated phospholipid phosphatase
LAQGAGDRWLFEQINGWGPRWSQAAAALSMPGVVASVFVLGAALGLRQPVVPAALLLAALGGGFGVQLMKTVLALPRPAAVLDGPALHVIGVALKARSMPSGQAMLFVAMATMAWLVPAQAGSRLQRWGTAAALSLLALAVAAAQVMAGAHWPSDLLAGAGLGLLVGLLLATARGRRLVRALAAALVSRAGSRVMVALVVAASSSLWVTEPTDPQAAGWQTLLALPGLLVALGWWRLHPDPLTAGLWRRVALRS